MNLIISNKLIQKLSQVFTCFGIFSTGSNILPHLASGIGLKREDRTPGVSPTLLRVGCMPASGVDWPSGTWGACAFNLAFPCSMSL
jgi:hypothetical protein